MSCTLTRLVVRELPHHRGHGLEPGLLRGENAALAGDDFEHLAWRCQRAAAIARHRPHDDRLHDAMFPHVHGELGELVLIEVLAAFGLRSR
jgi:hypothetical protein